MRPFNNLLSLLTALCIVATPLVAEELPTEQEVNQLFADIIDPVDLSYTEIYDALSALEPNIDRYSQATQIQFQRLWCWNQFNEENEAYIQYANQLLDSEAFQLDIAARADGLLCRGYYQYLDDNNEAALQDFELALNLAQRANNSLLMADAYSLMADVQSYQGEIARALANYKNAFQFYLSAGNEYFGNDIQTSVGNTLRRMGDFNNAEVYLAQQITYYQQKKDLLSEANVAIDYGLLYLEKNEPENALYWFDRTIALVRQQLEVQALQIDERSDATAYFYKAEALGRLGLGAQAQASLDQSFAIVPEETDVPLDGPTSMIKSYIAAANGDFLSAVDLARNAARYYTEEQNDRLLMNALSQIATAEAALKNYQAAYEAQKELELARERYRQQINEQLSERLKIEYNVSQTELKNRELQLRNDNQQLELESKKRIAHWQSITLLLAIILLVFLTLRVFSYIRSSRHLKTLALTDSLTDLANRRAIESLAEQAYAQSERNESDISFIAFDIDHFKQVNDRFGHEVGDLVIKKVAQLAKSCLRAGDTLARYGGEEFLAILPMTDIAQAVLVAQRICDTVAAETLQVRGKTIHITVSIGIAQKQDTEASPGLTIRRADTALYDAKNSGRNQIKWVAT